MLIKAGAGVGARDGNGRAPLSWAAEGCRDRVVLLLLQTGADVDTMDGEGTTILYDAAEEG